MDEGSLILGHVNAVIQQLKWAESALLRAEIDPQIKRAANVGFANLFQSRRRELEALLADVTEQGASVNAWKQLSFKSRRCSELFGECLGFLGGALLRGQQAGNDDICEIAEALLCELNEKLPATIEWGGVALLAEGNFYTETTGLIRLPFPDFGIWNLPISAHELGHFVGPAIPDGVEGSSFRTLLQEKEREHLAKQLPAEESAKQLSREVSHLKELFSDLFGVYTMGPAYAYSCILLRFGPADTSACKDNDTHPSHAKRVYFILEALEQMNTAGANRPYSKIKSRLESLWQANLQAAGNGKCLYAKDRQLLFELYTIINKHLPTSRYDGWGRAIDLRDGFMSGTTPAKLLGPNHTIADVLNAAWLWRLALEDEAAHVVHDGHRRAVELCREIMQRRQIAN